MSEEETLFIATRGSALALVQANYVLGLCREKFPARQFELKIIRTTGDKLQTASLSTGNQQLEKGLFTKELEVALLAGEARLAVHSLKDLPTELPEGLTLGATPEREDVRDVLIQREADFSGHKKAITGETWGKFRQGAVIATSSTRRTAQIIEARPDLKTVAIRGNVGTRLQKLAAQPGLDGIILAMAGLKRLGFTISDEGVLRGKEVPEGLRAVVLAIEEMLPCVGQAALGIEIRENDELAREICALLNHKETFLCVTAERAFLQAMGGGCLSPVAALARAEGQELRLQAISFREASVRRTEMRGSGAEAVGLGQKVAASLL